MALALRSRLIRASAPTLGAIFVVAVLLRAAWAIGVDEPLEYDHPYQYLSHALWVAERPDPLNVLVNYDNWRVHYDRWTAAPLYYLFLIGILKVFGHGMFWIRVIQCLLGGLAAVSLARIGARICGSRGRWAGVLFAVHLPLIQLCSTTLTEALYVPLMLLAFDLLLRSPERVTAFKAGLTHGLAALTRSVSSAFFAVIAFWMLATEGLRRGLPRAALLALGGMLTILPWTARNYFVMEEPILIETFAWENLWYANALVGPGIKEAQRRDIASQKTTAQQRERAVEITIENLKRRPDRIPHKIWLNFKHLVRPEGLHQWLTVRSDESPLRLGLQIVLEDGLYLLGWAGLALFLFRQRWNRASGLVLLWLGYSLFMVVVVFHNEVRYRNQIVPFLFVAGIAGWFGRGGRRESAGKAWAGRALAAAVVGLALSPYPALAMGVARANQAASDVSVLEPRPGMEAKTFWTGRFQSLADQGRLAEAADVFERLGAGAPLPVLTLAPRLLVTLGAEREASGRLAWESSAALEWRLWETRMQAIAWRRWPAPITPDRVEVGSYDLGLIRDFGPPLPRGGSPRFPARGEASATSEPETSRWTRGQSKIRLCVEEAGPATLTLRMSAPLPAPKAPIATSILFDGRRLGTVDVGREPRDYDFAVEAATCPGVIEIRSRVWSIADLPAELGVQVFSAGLESRPQTARSR
jgi:4-amino-4-deoxy-L-arabinose transferase-like glycosyltransferase